MDRSFLFEGKHFFKNNLKVQLSVSEETPFMMLHRHDFVELAYVYEGRGLHKIGDQIMLVSQGDLFIIRPGIPHVFQPLDLTGHRPLKVLNCLFTQEMDLNLQNCAPKSAQNHWSAHREQDNEFRLILESMYSIQQADNAPDLFGRLDALLQKLFTRLDTVHIPLLPKVQASEYTIHTAVQLIGTHYIDALSIHDICKKLSMSPRNFQRLFKRYTGKSYIQMLQKIRITYSTTLLEHSEGSVESIAQAIGIQDMKYFYRLFHEYMGTTPAAYRRQFQNQSRG